MSMSNPANMSFGDAAGDAPCRDAASMSSSDGGRRTAVSNAVDDAHPNAGAANMSPCRSDGVCETACNDEHAAPPNPDAASMAPCSDLACRTIGDCAANTPHCGDMAGERPPNVDAAVMAPCGDTPGMPPCGAAHVGDHASEAHPDAAHPDARAGNMAPCSDAASSGPDAMACIVNAGLSTDDDS